MEKCRGRRAQASDLDAVAAIYEAIHTAEEAGQLTIGWTRGVYPTRETAREALERGDLFAFEAEGTVVGAAIINQSQMEAYARVRWRREAPPEQVMVLHTLVIDPRLAGHGYGSAAVRFYEAWADAHGCPFLRMDTNIRNTRARRLYGALGYEERGVVECEFNGMYHIPLLMLEKQLGDGERAGGNHGI